MILSREPFLVKEEDQAILLARYMVEENKESHIEFSFDRTNELEIIKSVFKTIVGKTKNFTEEEILKIREELTEVINWISNLYKKGFWI